MASNTQGIDAALAMWFEQVDLEAVMVVGMTSLEVGTLHRILAGYQDLMEGVELPEEFAEIMGSIRHKVERALSQAGYGGDPRP